MDKMDKIDDEILKYLNSNSRASVSEISKKVHMSVPAVGERIRKLEDSGIINCYTIKIDRNKANLKVMAFISVNIDGVENIENFRKQIIKYSAVLECHHIAGQADYLLKVLLEDTNALECFLSNELKNIKGVATSTTTIVLSTLKEKLNAYE